MFASLGIALALHGRRAMRARVLNVAAVAVSVFMNALAAAPGWRALAIWAMPPVAYALASDTLIGVVRAWAIARQQALNVRLADEQVTPLAVLGGLVLWLLRLALAPGSTLAGFRRWVLEECPVAPGRAPGRRGGRSPAIAATRPPRRSRAGPAERHQDGPVPGPGGRAARRRWRPCRSPTCRGSAPRWRPRSGCTPARPGRALRQAVLAAQNGSTS